LLKDTISPNSFVPIWFLLFYIGEKPRYFFQLDSSCPVIKILAIAAHEVPVDWQVVQLEKWKSRLKYASKPIAVAIKPICVLTPASMDEIKNLIHTTNCPFFIVRDTAGELPRRPRFLLWHMTSISA
jgi:hypothetical protein